MTSDSNGGSDPRSCSSVRLEVAPLMKRPLSVMTQDALVIVGAALAVTADLCEVAQ